MAFGAALISLDKAELLSILVEVLLYGVSLLMFGGTIWALLSQRSARYVNRKILAVACLLLVISTTHVAIDIVRLVDAFIVYANASPQEPALFFSNVSQWTFVARQYVFTMQTLLGDGVILYRCFVVWQSKLIMVLPLLLWFGVGASGFGAAYVSHHVLHGGVFHSSLLIWLSIFWAFALLTNLVATGLLAFRIWIIDRRARKARAQVQSQLRPLLQIIIDAGLIYSITLLAALISFFTSSNFQYPMITPIIAFTFYMVIIRVGLANQAKQSKQGSSLPFKFSAGGSSDHELRVRVTQLSENKVSYGHSFVTTADQSGCGDDLAEHKGASLGTHTA